MQPRPNHPFWHLAVPAGLLLSLLGSEGASADGMIVSKGSPPIYAPGRTGGRDHVGRHRPRRLVTGGPGYVGSSWGLGKPSYWGIGTRPDDGDPGD